MKHDNQQKSAPGVLAASKTAAAGTQQQAAQHGASKRTFRDKFHSMLHEAQEANIKAVHRQELQDRRSLSVAMLMQGRPQAFVDFFMLSQPQYGSAPGASLAAANGAEHAADSSSHISQPLNALSLQSMIFLQEQLIAADAAAKAGQHEHAFAALAYLAKHFTQLGMLDKAVFFWKKGLQVSADWAPGELEASCALGLLYESLHQPHLAMGCHERCLQLALQLERHDDAAIAHAQLVQVYAQQAEQCSREGNTQGAAAYYLKCRDAALQCGDASSAGAAAHHLGLIHQQQDNWQEALNYQKAYMELSRQAGDQQAEGQACVAFAECQQRLGQLSGAMESLETYLEISRSQDPRGQATACCKLGMLYQQHGKLDQAVGYFERFFELARSLGDRRLLDIARVNLGAARATLRMPDYRQLCWYDLTGLLEWKCSRVPF